MARHPQRLQGGGRFAVAIEGDPPAVVKRGDPAALAREAHGLRLVAGLGLAPQLRRATRGLLVTGLLPGSPRRLERLPEAQAADLGRALRVVHEARSGASGGLPWWRSRARTLAAYARGREQDALAAAGRERDLASRVRVEPPPSVRTDRPFRLLHGDLVAPNILWGPEPRFVDWEFWRMGDPAEDLAYLFELNGMPKRVADAVLRGYGDAGMAERVGAWRALCALDAGLWYRSAGQEEIAARLVARAAALSDARRDERADPPAAAAGRRGRRR